MSVWYWISISRSKILTLKQLLVKWSKCLDGGNRVTGSTPWRDFFQKYFLNLSKKAGLGLIRDGIRVNQNCLTFIYIKTRPRPVRCTGLFEVSYITIKLGILLVINMRKYIMNEISTKITMIVLNKSNWKHFQYVVVLEHVAFRS